MVVFRNIKRMVLGALLFFYFSSYAQNEDINYNEFEGFIKLGFFASLQNHRKAIFSDFERSYSLTTNNSLSFSLGFDYVYKPTKEYSLRTGLIITSIPWFDFDLFIPKENNPANFPNDFNSSYRTGSNLVFSVPIYYELKKQLDKNLFFSAIGGVNISIMFSGEITTAVALNDGKGTSFEVFAAYAETNRFPLYPNLVLRPGFYYTGKKAIVQVSFIYQKAIVPFFKGEYQFGNLVDAEPVRGDLKITGDYLGIGLTVFLKKKKKKNI